MKTPIVGNKPVLAITLGDPAGIGPEITLKALSDAEIWNRCTPVVVGGLPVLRQAVSFVNSKLRLNAIDLPEQAMGCPGTVDVIDTGTLAAGDWKMCEVSAQCGQAAFEYIVRAIDLANKGQVAGVVTGPINKEALRLSGVPYAGHTEIFAHYTNTDNYAMMLCTERLNVVHATTHVPLRRACDLITEARITECIRLAEGAMKAQGLEHPRIAVAGLNPHASENGLFGNEERESIIPAVKACSAAGIDVTGPLPPDTVFVKAAAGQYDAVVAMYHDQGHIPVKLLGFQIDPASQTFSGVAGVNVTLGLPFVRTSVDHGTAFDIAGKGIANGDSLVEAIFLAARMSGGGAK
jgi:4-hydroxythreonine-4-phosphate dehydrogenase